MSEIGFSHPWLLLLALVPLALPLVRLLPSLRKRGLVSISTYDWMPLAAASPPYARWFADALRVLALLCLTLIAAGIRSGKSIPVTAESSEALVIVLDVSSSMTAEDFSPGNRLEAAKILLLQRQRWLIGFSCSDSVLISRLCPRRFAKKS